VEFVTAPISGYSNTTNISLDAYFEVLTEVVMKKVFWDVMPHIYTY
jgi:hypothetical protein